MGISVDYNLVCMIFFLPALCYSNQTNASKATFYKTSDGKDNGTCGYGNYASYMNNVRVTTVSSKLYNNGAGCGACYQVICKEKPVCSYGVQGTCSWKKSICSYDGTKLVVTDSREGPAGTDFIIPYENFGSLAPHPGVANYLYVKGVVDVNYKRVSCTNNNGTNLAFKINEHTNYPAYIAFVPINQGGLTDILAIEIYEEKCYKWIAMRRAYGAVFDLANPPSRPLKLRIQVSDQDDNMTRWVQPKKTITPSYWKPGTIIETDIQLP